MLDTERNAISSHEIEYTVGAGGFKMHFFLGVFLRDVQVQRR